MVYAVTSTDTPRVTHFLGIGIGAYDKRPDQDESLVNPNVVCYDIDERSKQQGGRESLLTEPGVVPIFLEEGKLPLNFTRCPITKELQSKKIHWIVPCSLESF